MVQNSPSASPEPDPGSVETRATFDLSWMDTPPLTLLRPPSVKEGLVRPTGGAGPLGHPGDQALLPAGRLQPEALVLVGVPAGAAHRDEVFVALQGQRRRRRKRQRQTQRQRCWDQFRTTSETGQRSAITTCDHQEATEAQKQKLGGGGGVLWSKQAPELGWGGGHLNPPGSDRRI